MGDLSPEACPHCGVAPVKPRLASRQTAATILGVSVRTVDRLLADGTFPVVHIGSRSMIPMDAIDDFIGVQAGR